MMFQLFPAVLAGFAAASVTTTALVEDGLSIGLVISMDTGFNTATLPAPGGTITTGASCAASTDFASQNPKKWEVQVGSQDDLSFAPEQIAASTGDIVEFTFFQNHTVTQSSLDTPCAPLLGGFNTGFNQYNPGTSNNVKVSFTVNSPKPQYFFCAQTDPFPHCELGMVFAINAGTEMNTFLSNVLASGALSSNASATTTTASSLTAGTQSLVTSPPFSNTTTSAFTSQTDLGPLPRTSLTSLGSLLGSSDNGSAILSSTLQSSLGASTGALTDPGSFPTPAGLQTSAPTSTVSTTSPSDGMPTSSADVPITTQSVTTTLSSNIKDSVVIPVVRTGAPFAYLNSTNGTLTILDALTHSATAVALDTQGSVLATPVGNRAVATADGMGGGLRSSRALAGGAVMALAIAIAMAVLG